ncbi:MAG TPA: hypothetical protein PK362_12025, partial [Elusimicrobiota bacterium]|nr:hypothetical protein [Elusimicrobiota bacterium]
VLGGVARSLWKEHQEGEQRLQEAVDALSPLLQASYAGQMKGRRKSLAVAYVLGVLGGLHHVYLGSLTRFLLFQFTAGGLLIWWTWDLGTMYFIVSAHNRREAFKILQNLSSLP